MRQLVELQKRIKEFDELDAQIICVFREERLGPAGAKKAQDSIKTVIPILVDTGSKMTADYSPTGFANYVIDKQGKIQAILPGVKVKRAAADQLLEALNELKSDAQ